MARQPDDVRRRVEEADTDALSCALLEAHLAVLMREARATANIPRVERLAEMAQVVEAMRRRAIARKQG